LCAFAVACGDDDSDGNDAKAGSGGNNGGTNAAGSGNGGDGASGAGGSGTSSSQVPADFEGLPTVSYGPPPSNCTEAGTNRDDTLVLDLTPTNNVLVLTTKDAALQVNDVTCTGVNTLTNIEIHGSSAGDTVIIDGSWGDAPESLRAGTISFDGAEGDDSLAIAGTREADTVKLGTQDDSAQVVFGAAWPRILVKNQEKLTLVTGPGDDRVEAQGGDDLGAPLAVGLTLYAGADNDYIQGGAGNDELHAGTGDDVFQTAASPDGADSYDGAAGADSLSYERRTQAVSITVDGQANDGESAEGDNVDNSIETLVGGGGDDTVSAGSAANTIVGGPGNDTLLGGAGDDLFVETKTVQGADLINGGSGSDTIDYSERSVDLSVSLCAAADSCNDACACAADDGADGEKDTLVSVENAYGGNGSDKFVGTPAANTFFGNGGNDELRGEGGNDVLYGDDGDDKLVGGDGEDTLYSGDGNNTCDGGAGQGDICICSPDSSNKGCELS
jgi:Ca2+-binding RTX toxin-like protein